MGNEARDSYGNAGPQYPLADWLFGHRLIEGQHWLEYLLEFLNVLKGFDYQLGRGLSESGDAPGYRRYARYGLRRFVFYDKREKTQDARDEWAVARLTEQLRRLEGSGLATDEGDAIQHVRELLRSYSAVEEQRSWFAKSLFPAHENMLYWEALRKGATKRRARDDSSAGESDPDAGLSLGARNFFARGGEIYYLILSAGTEGEPARREFLESRLRGLLQRGNPALGRLAHLVEDAWAGVLAEAPWGDSRRAGGGDSEDSELGWVPDRGCGLYSLIAEDAATLLAAELDPLESLDLLAHLVCFHLLIFIYHRAGREHESALESAEGCVARCRPLLPIDCLDGQNIHLRRLSAALYKEQEARQQSRGRDYVAAWVDGWVESNPEGTPTDLVAAAEFHFSIARLRSKAASYQAATRQLLELTQASSRNLSAFAIDYKRPLHVVLDDGFRQQFLGVHRKLARSIGFLLPFQGPSQRFVLGPTVLKALILANIPPEHPLEYGDLLERLYERYGLVIGQREAHRSGLYARKPINAEYFDQNRASLQEKLKYAGLLNEYSDATALVLNPSRRHSGGGLHAARS